MGEQTKIDRETIVKFNEDNYKEEVVKNWGSDSYEKSKKQFKNMSDKEYEHFNNLERSIINVLKEIKKDIENENLKKKVALLHKEWISIAWDFYDRNIHLNVADNYVLDERFAIYYDQHGEGLAVILRDAIKSYI